MFVCRAQITGGDELAAHVSPHKPDNVSGEPAEKETSFPSRDRSEKCKVTSLKTLKDLNATKDHG